MNPGPRRTRFRNSPVRWIVRRFFQLCGLVFVFVWLATVCLWVTSFARFPDSFKRAFGYEPDMTLSGQALLSTGHFRLGVQEDDIYSLVSYEGRVWLSYWAGSIPSYHNMRTREWLNDPRQVEFIRGRMVRIAWPTRNPAAKSHLRDTIVSSWATEESIDVYILGSSFPHWLLLLVLSVPALFGTRSYRRAWRAYRRRRRGLCEACGYNLTGLTSSTCPECGCAFEPGAFITPQLT